MESNIRIVWDNAADRAAIAASSEAGNLFASNLRTNLKSKVWRGSSPSEGLVLTWPDPEPVDVVVLAFNNMTAQATMRVRGYTQTISPIPVFDTGDVECQPPAPLGAFGWGGPFGENFYERGGASLFAYGYGAYAVVWIPGGHAVRKLEILVNDPDNPDGYIEAGRLIVGPYWTPLHNFSFGHSVSFPELTQNKRSEAGDLRGERGAKWRRIDFDLQYMDEEDRSMMLRMLRRAGLSQPLFISLFPENEDAAKEQSYQLFGKFADTARVSQPNFDIYATSLAVEET